MTEQLHDRFSLPCEIADDAPTPGTLSHDWRARGLASPAGRGWEPVLRQAQDEPAADARLAQSIAALAETPEEPRSVFTRERQVAFLHALAASGAVRPSAASIGISYRTVYRERRANAGFRRAWDAALLSARALHEDVLAARAIDGVEEVVWFRGEEVGRRVRYDSRLLLAHLARLDKLTEDARVSAFADDYEGALERFAAGIDDPAPVCPDCGEALPMVAIPPGPAHAHPSPTSALPELAEGPQSSGGESVLRQAQHERVLVNGEGEAPGFVPGLCDRCDSPSVAAAAERAARREAEARIEPCPDCGGRCLGPAAELTEKDCRSFDSRWQRFRDARPPGALQPARSRPRR